MSGSQLQRKLDSKRYTTPAGYARDVRLVWRNCQTYNKEDSEYHALAGKLAKYFDDKFSNIKWAAEGDRPRVCSVCSPAAGVVVPCHLLTTVRRVSCVVVVCRRRVVTCRGQADTSTNAGGETRVQPKPVLGRQQHTRQRHRNARRAVPHVHPQGTSGASWLRCGVVWRGMWCGVACDVGG